MQQRDRIAIEPPRADWLAQVTEDIIEPDLPICDPHHHLWDRLGGYLGDELTADIGSGHNIVSTVFIQCRYAHFEDGPRELRPVGETHAVMKVVDDVAARGVGTDVCAGIVGFADLTLGAAVDDVLAAHKEAARGRFRGIRHITATEPSFETYLAPVDAGVMGTEAFRAGFARLAPAGLSFDGWLYHPQIPEFTDLARAFPDTSMVLDHVGGPLGLGRFRGQEKEVFADWKASLAALSDCPNVTVKLGGLGMDITGCTFSAAPKPPGSQALADRYRPWVETVIELFGPDRCMFESNFPVDKVTSSYHVLWNAFKILAQGASADEKRLLFHDTATRVYRIGSGPE